MSNKLPKLKDQFFASCPKELEAFMLEEMKEFDLLNIKEVKGGVHFEAPMLEALNFVLNTKIASRVYKKLYQFTIKREKDIYFEASKVKWKAIFNLEQTFKIKSLITPSENGKRWSQYKNSMFLSMMLKDAIVDNFQNDKKGNGLRPDVEKGSADISFLLLTQPKDNEFAKNEQCTIMIDLCGDPLSSRGYRTKTVTAPLRENLASAVAQTILNENKTKYYMDTMCGSGTSLIEMFMQFHRLPGSYIKLLNNTPFAFERLNFFQKDPKLKDEYGELVNNLKEDIEKKLAKSHLELHGSDIDSGNVRVARENIENARLSNQIMIKDSDALELQTDQKEGVIFANMPYGERLGDQKELEGLYYDYGEHLKNHFKGFAAYVFTGNMPLLKKISLRTSKKHIFWNAKIECRLARYELF
jgi:23S rRNA G2445 N2-methylase RlmL